MLLPALLLLGACIPRTNVDFAYRPGVSLNALAGAPLRVEVLDERRRPADSAGEVRGLMGSTAGRAVTSRPVAELVRAGIEAGLVARGLALATPGQAGPVLSVALRQFEAVQVVQRGATARFTVRLLDSAGRELWRHEEQQREIDRTLGGGAGTAPVSALSPILARLLRNSVDKVLDDPGFRAALAR